MPSSDIKPELTDIRLDISDDRHHLGGAGEPVEPDPPEGLVPEPRRGEAPRLVDEGNVGLLEPLDQGPQPAAARPGVVVQGDRVEA